MVEDALRQWHDHLELQRGVITRRQALVSGISRDAIAVRLRSGRWQRLHHGVYATFSGQPNRQALLWAAVLRAGRGATLSHQTAAELHGLVDTPTTMIHVTVRSGSQVGRMAGVVVHYSGRLESARHPTLSPPRTRIDETVLDLTQTAANLDAALKWVLCACGRRLTTPDRLSEAIRQRIRMRWRAEISAAIVDAAQGVHSSLERRYLINVERPHGLPCATRQAKVVRGRRSEYRDVYYDEYDTAVELDGLVAHPVETRWMDIHRDNANTAEGCATLRFNWADVTQHPCRVATQIGRVLNRRGWTGTPRRCGPACTIPRERHDQQMRRPNGLIE
jgi:hypothetical protein